MHSARFLMALTLVLAAGTARAEGNALRAMTFNVRFGTANDGEDAWPQRKDRLVALVREAAPDIMGVQECLDFQAEYIAEELPEFAWIGRGRNADGDGEMTAVFYRKERLVPEQTTHFWLSETPEVPGSQAWDAALPRMATQVRFVDKRDGQAFLCFNTHFDHRGATARLESAKLLAARVEGAPSVIPVLVLGDFNAEAESSAPWAAMTAGGLKDAWQIAAARKGTPNTWNGFTMPNPADARRIDWILVREGMRVDECAILDQTIDGRYPSDHFPVLAVVVLR